MQTVNRGGAGNNSSIHNKFSWPTLQGSTTVHTKAEAKVKAKAGYNVLFEAAVEEASESNTEWPCCPNPRTQYAICSAR